jgi:predicted Zn-dependent protease
VPLALDSPFESTHNYTIQLPPYFTLESHLTDRLVRSKWGVFQLTVKTDPDDPHRIELEYFTRIDKVHVDPEDFPAFRKFHEDVSKAYRVWITIRNSTAIADAGLLEAQLQLTPGDAAAARLLAELYLRNHKPDEARRVLTRARAFNADNSRLAELAVKAAPNLKEEEKIYRDLIRHFPKEWKYVVSLGRNLVEQNRLADARTELRPVLTKAGPVQRSQGHYQMARIALLENHPANALTQYQLAQVAEAETVNNVAALRLKASIYEKLKQPADEAGAYREILLMDSDNPEALEALVRLELADNQNAKALDYLRRFTLAAQDGNSLAKAADLHLRMERYEDAFDLASKARELVEGNSLAQRTLGLVYLHRGNHAKAAFHLERADIDAAVLSGLLQSRLALGQLSLAAQDADQADKIEKPPAELVQICQATLAMVQRRKSLMADVKIPADKLDAWSEAADRLVCAEYAWKNDRSTADVESLLRGAFAPGIEMGPAFGLRGLLNLERGRLLLADQDAERAIKHSPNDPIGYLVRGRVRLERGQADALNDLKKAAQLSQNKDGRILHWLATSLWRAGEKDEARKTQQAAVQLRPVDKELSEQLHMFEQ